ncbi:MAG: tail fiber domain-containing protein, partial [Chlorobiales bacterium]|nr:tail fiber domain-containing protein [Chlorobiales bacterium]
MTWTLPSTDGSSNQVLQTDGGGILSWNTAILSNLTDNTANVLDIQEGANNYINVSTADNSEAIAFGNITTDPNFSFLGEGTINVGESSFSNTNAVMRLSATADPHLILEDVGNSVSGLANATNDLILASQHGGFEFRTDVTDVGDWSTTGTKRVEIQSDGEVYIAENLGIGTDSPSSKIHMLGDNTFMNLQTSNTNADTGFQFYEAGVLKGKLVLDGKDIADDSINLYMEGKGALNLIDSGVVQLHATSDQPLSLQGSLVGINNGTNNAILEFQKSGVKNYQIAVDNSNNHLQIVNANGVVQMHTEQGHTDWHANSDSRLKENIQEITVLDNLDNYRAVSFNWKDSGRNTIGVIAQELYEVFPEFVSVGAPMDEELLADRSNAWSVMYASLAPVALQGVKELAVITDDNALSIDQLAQSVDSHSMRLEAVGSEGDLSLEQLKTNVSNLLTRVVEL